MYSEGEDEPPLGGGHRCSPTPPRRGRSGGRSRSPGRGRDGGRGRRGDDGATGGSRSAGAGGSKGGGKRPRTTGRALPKLNSIHKGTIASIQTYGAFVQLGDGSEFKDGLLHVSRLSASGRIEQVEDVVAQGDAVWVKVVEVKEEEGKYSLDMRYVGQRDGEDKDPNNTHVDTGGSARGKGADPIRIGAVQSTTCSRCGARGHGARECFAANGKQYALMEEPSDEPTGRREQPPSEAHSQNPELVKEALRYYLKRKAGEASSSSSSSSSSGKKKKKKQKKMEKKAKKKAKKKEKKELKKLKKKQKKEAKAAAKGSKEVEAAAHAKEGREATEVKEATHDREAKSTKKANGQGVKKDGDDSSSSSSS